MASGGGFVLSPPYSVTGSSTISTAVHLPHPRSSPLRPGGPKESAFIRHVDNRILHIQRRFAKRTSPVHASLADSDRDQADSWGDVSGYSTMREACKEIAELVDVVWVSGTPSLQVPYLINLALLLSTVVPAMPLSPKALFAVLSKMDRCFASLIQGRDVESGETLPGFSGMRGVSGTEKVRIRSLVERTRVGVMEAFKKGEFDEEPSEEMNAETDDEDGLVLENADDDMGEMEEEEDSWDMQLARVYDRTIQELGDSLKPIGIATEMRG